jgi:hypothetical protein
LAAFLVAVTVLKARDGRCGSRSRRCTHFEPREMRSPGH